MVAESEENVTPKTPPPPPPPEGDEDGPLFVHFIPGKEAFEAGTPWIVHSKTGCHRVGRVEFESVAGMSTGERAPEAGSPEAVCKCGVSNHHLAVCGIVKVSKKDIPGFGERVVAVIRSSKDEDGEVNVNPKVFRERIGTLTKDLKSVTSKYDHAAARAERVDNQLKKSHASLAEHKKSEELVKLRVKELEGEITALSEKAAQRNKDYTKMMNTVSELRKTLAEEKHKSESAQADLKDEKNKKSELKKALEAKVKECKEFERGAGGKKKKNTQGMHPENILQYCNGGVQETEDIRSVNVWAPAKIPTALVPQPRPPSASQSEATSEGNPPESQENGATEHDSNASRPSSGTVSDSARSRGAELRIEGGQVSSSPREDQSRDDASSQSSNEERARPQAPKYVGPYVLDQTASGVDNSRPDVPQYVRPGSFKGGQLALRRPSASASEETGQGGAGPQIVEEDDRQQGPDEATLVTTVRQETHIEATTQGQVHRESKVMGMQSKTMQLAGHGRPTPHLSGLGVQGMSVGGVSLGGTSGVKGGVQLRGGGRVTGGSLGGAVFMPAQGTNPLPALQVRQGKNSGRRSGVEPGHFRHPATTAVLDSLGPSFLHQRR